MTTMNKGEETPRTIASSNTLLDIIEYVGDNGIVGVTEIADALDKPKSTIHPHLQTLKKRRFVVSEEGKYRLGTRFLNVGGKVISQNDLYHVAKPEIEELAEETGESVQLGIEEHGTGYYLYQTRGPKAVRTDSVIGTERPLHVTAFGKVILAFLSEDRVQEIVEQHGLPKVTENSITEYDALLEELSLIRDRGVAFDESELIVGIQCVAAPIFDQDEEVIGAISVSGPRKRMSGTRLRQTIPSQLKDVARIVEINISNI